MSTINQQKGQKLPLHRRFDKQFHRTDELSGRNKRRVRLINHLRDKRQKLIEQRRNSACLKEGNDNEDNIDELIEQIEADIQYAYDLLEIQEYEKLYQLEMNYLSQLEESEVFEDDGFEEMINSYLPQH